MKQQTQNQKVHCHFHPDAEVIVFCAEGAHFLTEDLKQKIDLPDNPNANTPQKNTMSKDQEIVPAGASPP